MPNFTSRAVSAPLNSTLQEQVTEETNKSLPPFEVLLAWMNYFHAETGEWPLPPAGLAEKNLKSLPLVAQENSEVAKLQVVETKPVLTDFYPSYDYVNSVYFTEATQIIENYSNLALEQELLFGCKLTLSLILAWCHFSLFSEMNNRQGRWMVLATQHCTRQLRMRTLDFKRYITELERIGIINIGSVGNYQSISQPELEQLKSDCEKVGELLQLGKSSFWNKRTVQTKTTIYKLSDRIKLSVELPKFNPFRKQSEIETPEIQGKTFFIGERVENSKTLPKALPEKTFPESMNHVLINHDVDKLDFLQAAKLKRLNSEQRACFDFLNQEAYFVGYAREDGRATLDTDQILKLILTYQLTLETARERYDQVKEMWLNGQCRKNPLGLLHWAICNNQDPRGKVLAFPKPVSNFATEKAISPQKQPTSRNSQKKLSPEKLQKWQSLSNSSLAEKPELFNSSEQTTSDVTTLTPKELTKIWREICEVDLIGRFRLNPNQLALLQDSQLESKPMENGLALTVILRSVIEEAALSVASRNVIQMALRQKIGSTCQLNFTVKA